MLTRTIATLVCCLSLSVAWSSAAAANELILDDAGRVVVEIDDEGRRTNYAYHPNGQVSRIAYSDGRVEEFDDQGNPVPSD